MENERSSDSSRPPSNKYSCPWLMISHYALEEQTFYNILEDRSYCAKMIPDLLHKRPISTNQPGWVLVQGDRSRRSDLEEEREQEEEETDDEEEETDDEEEDDADHNYDDDEVDGGNSDEADDGDVDEEDNDVSDGDGDGDEEDGQEDDDGEEEEDVSDGDGDEVDEFGHEEDDDGDEVDEFGHDDDFGSAEAAEECDDASKVVCFLWNINTLEKIPITDYKDITTYYNCCLLSPSPGESDCFIYLFKKTSIFFGRLNDHTLSHRVVLGDDNVPMVGAVIVENKVFCILGDTEVVIGTPVYRKGWCLDLTRYTTNNWIYSPIGVNSSYINIIEYQGEVIYLKMSTYGYNYFDHVHSFWVYRFNIKKKTWEPLDDIGQTAIFITADMVYPTGFGIRSKVSSEDEKKGLRPNSIYFTYYSKFIYIYSLEDQTISYFCPCPIVTNYHFQWVLF